MIGSIMSIFSGRNFILNVIFFFFFFDNDADFFSSQLFAIIFCIIFFLSNTVYQSLFDLFMIVSISLVIKTHGSLLSQSLFLNFILYSSLNTPDSDDIFLPLKHLGIYATCTKTILFLVAQHLYLLFRMLFSLHSQNFDPNIQNL